MPFCEVRNILDGAFLADSLMTDESRVFWTDSNSLLTGFGGFQSGKMTIPGYGGGLTHAHDTHEVTDRKISCRRLAALTP